MLSSLVTVFLVVGAPGLQAGAPPHFVRNGSLSRTGVPAAFKKRTQARIEKLRAQGWHCPDADGWPTWWSGEGANVTVEYLSTGGKDNDGFLRLTGKGGYVSGYYGTPLEGDVVLSFWARGKGTLRAGFKAWKMSDDHKKLLGMIRLPALVVKVATDKWVRYRHLLRKPDYEVTLHPTFTALEGTLDFDEVAIEPSNPALEVVVSEEEKLYGTGALIEDKDLVQADETFAARRDAYRAAVDAFRAKVGTLDAALAQSLEKTIANLHPYLFSQGITTVQASRYNDMLVLTRALERLAQVPVGPAVRVQVKAAPPPAIDYKPGVRKPRAGTVTITSVRSNKVRYDETERARTQVTLVNTADRATAGTLVARMILDLDTARPLARASFTIGARRTGHWSFSYNVGPETYGRAIEVRFIAENGEVLDRWQEYYAVAAEYFRVHQQTHAGPNKLYKVDPWVTYCTLQHYHANEPTDAGVQRFDAEVIISGQGGYRVNQAARQARIDRDKKWGIQSTFYQRAFCGQMGYEVVRRHPEFALYDENGQFAVDPVYGGYPNPMELASPLEVGPKRKTMTIKPYLDRFYTPWQHVLGNWAYEDTVVFQAKCVKAYAKLKHFGGVYVDGNMGAAKGYAYDGKPNVPGGKPEDYARINARNHELFSGILKADDPNFGTWYNWGCDTQRVWRAKSLTQYYGSGFKGDANDASIRTALSYPNVMVLTENQRILTSKRGICSYPAKLLAMLIRQRDFIVQKYEGNSLIGYNFLNIPVDDPGPSKWGWPTVNYFTAQLIATQQHHAGGFWPSYRPGLQFMTRYSRFIWARDIKAVPVTEVRKRIRLQSPEKLWWKRLVYRRTRQDGYDLIVHLVRIPPTEQWDIHWVVEPKPLAHVRLTVHTGGDGVAVAYACRPYYFEEDQQVVQTALKVNLHAGTVTVNVPSFRYHTMVVFRFDGKRGCPPALFGEQE